MNAARDLGDFPGEYSAAERHEAELEIRAIATTVDSVAYLTRALDERSDIQVAADLQIAREALATSRDPVAARAQAEIYAGISITNGSAPEHERRLLVEFYTARALNRRRDADRAKALLWRRRATRPSSATVRCAKALARRHAWRPLPRPRARARRPMRTAKPAPARAAADADGPRRRSSRGGRR